MSDTESIILTSVVLAVPVGIVTNLLSSPIQRRVDRALKRSGETRQRTRAAYAEQISLYAEDSTSFHIYLTEQILRTTVFTALFGLLSGLAFAAGQGAALTHLFIFNVVNGLDLIGQLAALIGTLIVFTIARNALRTVISVRNAKKTNQHANHADDEKTKRVTEIEGQPT